MVEPTFEIYTERTRRRISQQWMAAALGISPAVLSAIENGKARLTPEQEQRAREILTEYDSKAA